MFRMSRKDLSRAHLLMGESAQTSTEAAESEVEIFASEGIFSALCLQANITKRERGRILGFLGAASALLACIALLSKAFLLPAAILPWLIAAFYISRRAFKRAENFERDYPALLLSLSSSVRTGLDPLSAMIESEKLFEPDSEVRKELYKFKISIERGKPEAEAIRDFAASISHPDIQLFRTGYLLARRQGSSLAECLQRLARVTRQRQSFRRKIRSAVAMQRLSAFGIGGCSLLICGIQAMGNPRIITDTLAHPLGQRMLIAGAVLISLGLLWMVRMTRSSI